MAIKKNKRLMSLFFLGILCLLTAGGQAFISFEMSMLVIVLSCVGVASIIIASFFIFYQTKKGQLFFLFRRCVFFVIAFCCCALFYGGINAVAKRFDRRWDLTQFKQHTLSDRTLEIINALEQPVQLIAFHVGLPPKYLEDLLKEYERNSSGRISTEIVDPLSQIGYAAQFGDVISGKEKKVIALSGKERRDVDFTTQVLTEEQLTNTLVRVTRKKSYVYFVTGHGEASLSVERPSSLTKFAISLIENNISAKELLLTDQTQIPEDCDVLIFAGPKEEY